MVIKNKEYQKSLFLFFLVGVGVVLSLQLYPTLKNLLPFNTKSSIEQQVAVIGSPNNSPEILIKDGQTRRVIQEPRSFALQGMKSRIFLGNQLVTQSQIDRIRVQPQKLLFFRLNKVNEIVMESLRLESYISRSGRQPQNDFGLFSSFGDLLGGEPSSLNPKHRKANNSNKKFRFGGVEKGVIHDFRWKIYRENQPYLLIKSPLVQVNFKTKQIQLINAEIEYLKYQRRIRSKIIAWNDGEGQFKIPYHFVTLYPDGSRYEGWHKTIRP